MNTSVGYVDKSPQGSIASQGQFNYDDTWRWGFTVNRASSTNYVRDFHLVQGLAGDQNVLTSQLYLEGFGEGAYTRLDSKLYQGLERSDCHQPAADRAAALHIQLLSARRMRWAAGCRWTPELST